MTNWKSLVSAGALVSLLLCVGCPAEDGAGKTDGGDATTDGGDATTDGGDATTDGGDAADAGDADKGGDDTGMDVSNAKVGQKYTYSMANDMSMVYEVTSITDAEIKYNTSTIMGGKALGDPTEVVIPLKAPEPTGDAAAAKAPEPVSEETLTVAGQEFKCKVYETNGAKSWTTLKFPFMIKSQGADGKVTMELTAIE